MMDTTKNRVKTAAIYGALYFCVLSYCTIGLRMIVRICMDIRKTEVLPLFVVMTAALAYCLLLFCQLYYIWRGVVNAPKPPSHADMTSEAAGIIGDKLKTYYSSLNYIGAQLLLLSAFAIPLVAAITSNILPEKSRVCFTVLAIIVLAILTFIHSLWRVFDEPIAEKIALVELNKIVKRYGRELSPCAEIGESDNSGFIDDNIQSGEYSGLISKFPLEKSSGLSDFCISGFSGVIRPFSSLTIEDTRDTPCLISGPWNMTNRDDNQTISNAIQDDEDFQLLPQSPLGESSASENQNIRSRNVSSLSPIGS